MDKSIVRALKYLGFKGTADEEQLRMVEHAMMEIKQVARPACLHTFYKLHKTSEGVYFIDGELNLDYNATKRLFDKGESELLCILVSTIGPAVDKRIAKYRDTEPSRMVLLDACASSYVEEITDSYQAKLGLKDETFRYAPGYGDVPLTMQREIFNLMPEISKIGIELDETNFMHPFKSMTGLIGFRK